MSDQIVWPAAYDDWSPDSKRIYGEWLAARGRQPDPYPRGRPDDQLLSDIISGVRSPKGRKRRRKLPKSPDGR